MDVPWNQPWKLPKHAVQAARVYMGRLTGTFSLQFVILLFLAYCFVKGTLYSFLESAILPYFQSYVKVCV